MSERHWVEVRLRDVAAKIVDGSHNPPHAADDGYPMLSARKVENGQIVWKEYRLVGLSDFERENARTAVTPGDVLLTIVGSIGRSAVVASGSPRFLLQRSVAVLSFPGLVPHFMSYLFQGPDFQRHLREQARGTAQKGVYLKTLGDSQVEVPPAAEQQRIVEALDSYLSRLDAAVANVERAQARLKAYRASVLKAAVEGRLVSTEAEIARRENRDYEPAQVLLDRILKERRRRWEEAELARLTKAGKAPKGDKWKAKYEEPAAPDTSKLPSLPEGWCWASVEQVASDRERSIQSGPFGSSLLHSQFQSEGKLVIGIDNVQDGFFSMGAEHRISEKKFRELEKYRARGGDVLVTVMATVGRTCVVPEGIEDAIITKHVYRITPQPALVAPNFLHLMLWGAPAVREQMFGQVIGQTRPGLNGSIIRGLAISIAPRPEQDRIIERAEALLSSRAQALEGTARTFGRIARLRRAILKWAFDGKLVDEDPRDEPAEKLLTRIRAERESAPAKKKTRSGKVKAA